MPLVAIPVKAESRYFELCKACFNATDEDDFWRKNIHANAYLEAIRDLTDSHVSRLILMGADLQMPEGLSCCGGVPISWTHLQEWRHEKEEVTCSTQAN